MRRGFGLKSLAFVLLGTGACVGPLTGEAAQESEASSSDGGSETGESTQGSTTEAGSTDGGTASGGDGDSAESSSEETGGDTGPDEPLPTEVRNYIFGHSLLLHSDTQNVPRWLAALSAAEGYGYAMSGQYGFSDTHADNLPPFAQWGVPGVDSAWDSDSGMSFADVDFTTVLFTAANFRQYYPPTESDPDGFLDSSVVENTIEVFDWVEAEEAGVRYIIYENWPDMAGFTSADFSGSYPSAPELEAYYDYMRGDFHQWWLDYQDAMLAQRPELEVRMVPVGPILAELLSGTLSDIPPEALYEDDAPHGEATLYFLAGLATYSAIYGEPAPADFVLPDDIHPAVGDNYTQVVDEVWEYLESFDDEQGVSRVW